MDAERGFWDSKDGFGISAEVSRPPGLSPSRGTARHPSKIQHLALAFFPITQLARSGVESHYNHVNHMGGPFNARSSAREGLSQGAGVFALAVGVFGLKVGARLWI